MYCIGTHAAGSPASPPGSRRTAAKKEGKPGRGNRGLRAPGPMASDRMIGPFDSDNLDQFPRMFGLGERNARLGRTPRLVKASKR